MQNLNQDTNIDDIFVTCGQYQLFIDEKRAGGEYYQPDHWTSYQFPAGQGEWPILGVRHADALVYCQWLTEREDREWSYRLPTREEAKNLPFVSLRQYPLCYWLSQPYQFAWVGAVRRDPRGIGHLEDKFARDLKVEHARGLAADLALELNGTLALDLDRVLSLARSLTLDLDRAVVRARLLASALAPALARVLDRARKLNGARIQGLGRVRDLARARALALALPRVPAPRRRPDRDLQFAFDMYVDILTLQERIAGRSPAFEGIRMVKGRRT